MSRRRVTLTPDGGASLWLLLALMVLALLMASAREANEPPIVPCTTDTDCATKNRYVCGGPYEPACLTAEGR